MSNQENPRSESTAFERVGGKMVLLALAALSSCEGIVALLTGRLAERGTRSAPLRVSEWSGLAAYAGGVFLVLVGITLVVLAFRGLRSPGILKVLLAVDVVALVAAFATRL
jgi:hypothetical protein